MAAEDTHIKTQERIGASYSGTAAAALLFAAGAATLCLLILASEMEALLLAAIPLLVLTIVFSTGFFTLQPNMAAVLTCFGHYVGTDRSQGLRWVPFWIIRRKISLRVRNVTSEKLKVNDNRGNPIEIAANVVWRIEDSARAVFDVDDYAAFITIQIETGLRAIASAFAYDHDDGAQPTLRASGDHIAEVLKDDLQKRVESAGIAILDARFSHLAYAPEIAGSMLRRQQATAVLEARKLIVMGAVGMVEHALSLLDESQVVKLDDERRAAMVSNLLVVLCSDHDAQPVLNTGTLYG